MIQPGKRQWRNCFTGFPDRSERSNTFPLVHAKGIITSPETLLRTERFLA